MKTSAALTGGLAGAAAVTLIHETVRRIVPEPPRMDLLGKNAISKGLEKVGLRTPGENALFTWALAGDLVTNSLYYSLAGIGDKKNIWLRSSLLGLTAGVCAVALPKPLGLHEKHTNKSLETKLMTVGLYVAGALVSTAIIKLMEKRKVKKNAVWEQRLVTSAMG
jgi:hypothetical protein